MTGGNFQQRTCVYIPSDAFLNYIKQNDRWNYLKLQVPGFLWSYLCSYTVGCSGQVLGVADVGLVGRPGGGG